jgi:protocatechuate 3,4-dioxygenase beta subunit
VAQSIAPPSGTGGLGGIVKDQDGNPVRRCTVTIIGDMRLERTTVADDEGRFSFTSLPSGRFTITAKKAGYPEMSYGAKRPFRTGSGVFLQDGQQVRDLALTLARGATLTGTVYDDHGQPMPGVPVMAWEIRTSLGGERTLDSPASGPDTVITDDRGMYRIYGLTPGEYTVGTTWYYSGLGYDVRVLTDAEIRAAFQAASQSAAVPGAPVTPPPDLARHNYSAVFSPGVNDPLAAATFSVAAGEERAGVDLRMQFVPMSGIEGVVVTPNGSPAATRLSIIRRSPVQALNTTSVRFAQAGVPFSSGSLSPGRYTVLAEVETQPGVLPMWAMADAMVAGDKPVSVSLALQPGLTATGRVAFESGASQPPGDLSKVSIFLRPHGPVISQAVSAVDSAGVLSIAGVIPRPIPSHRVDAGECGRWRDMDRALRHDRWTRRDRSFVRRWRQCDRIGGDLHRSDSPSCPGA